MTHIKIKGHIIVQYDLKFAFFDNNLLLNIFNWHNFTAQGNAFFNFFFYGIISICNWSEIFIGNDLLQIFRVDIYTTQTNFFFEYMKYLVFVHLQLIQNVLIDFLIFEKYQVVSALFLYLSVYHQQKKNTVLSL